MQKTWHNEDFTPSPTPAPTPAPETTAAPTPTGPTPSPAPTPTEPPTPPAAPPTKAPSGDGNDTPWTPIFIILGVGGAVVAFACVLANAREPETDAEAELVNNI